MAATPQHVYEQLLFGESDDLRLIHLDAANGDFPLGCRCGEGLGSRPSAKHDTFVLVALFLYQIYRWRMLYPLGQLGPNPYFDWVVMKYISGISGLEPKDIYPSLRRLIGDGSVITAPTRAERGAKEQWQLTPFGIGRLVCDYAALGVSSIDIPRLVD